MRPKLLHSLHTFSIIWWVFNYSCCPCGDAMHLLRCPSNGCAMDCRCSHFSIPKLLESHVHKTAFWTVLSAANLSLVEWLCDYVKENPDEVVSKLTQMVILSLAQQLGSNLKSKTKLKLAWIKAACLSLNTQDDNIRKHIPKVLGNVQDSLQKHYLILKIDTNSQHPLRTEYVMVTHLVKSLSMTT